MKVCRNNRLIHGLNVVRIEPLCMLVVSLGYIHLKRACNFHVLPDLHAKPPPPYRLTFG